jgi:ABC-type uncharacterized transport system permease subunit
MKYLYIIKTQIIKSMTYEFNVYGNIIMQTIIMITSAYFWKALYKDQSMVGGVDAQSMLTYIIISSALSVLLITNVERRIERSVEKGTVATDMMKPVNLFGVYFAEDIGSIMELILRQFRHISFHTGMLNGQTILEKGEFPMWVSETEKYVDDGKFFERYRKGKVQL